jgi:hypothetical protein
MITVGLQCKNVRFKLETDRAERTVETAMGGRYAIRPVVLTLGAESAATGVSLMALTERVHSDGARPSGRKYLLLMQQLFTTQDSSTITNCEIDGVAAFPYWAMRMLKWHLLTLHHGITVYNYMYDDMDCIMGALGNEKTE